jgi:hypothetical protein
VFVGGSYSNKIILAIFVNAGIICSLNEGTIDQVLHHMRYKLKLTTGVLEVYVGLHIECDMNQHIIQLDQTRYMIRKLAEFGFTDCVPISVPANPHAQMDLLSSADEQGNENFPYGKIVGSIHFASQGTRPDVTYATCHASKFTKQPKTSHIS